MSDVRSTALADPGLPRSNGELTFDEPWQGRALAMAIALVERFDLQWDDFRQHLIAAIDAGPDRPYWDSWAVALDAFVAERLPDVTHVNDDGDVIVGLDASPSDPNRAVGPPG